MTSRNYLIAVPAVLLALSAMANGDHAGSHDHESDAIGKPGVAARATRTVKVDMSDTMRYSFDNLAVRQGETVRFVVTNSGKVKHEMVLGTGSELKEHAELMKKFPGMEHADANMVTVAPGQTGEIIWQFTRPGKVEFACLQPGHYEAGMKGVVTVAGGAMTEGVVRKVDLENRKITLKHGAITNLDMPPMTMVFQVRDAVMLDKVKAGDKVRFTASNDGGKLTVVQIEPTK